MNKLTFDRVPSNWDGVPALLPRLSFQGLRFLREYISGSFQEVSYDSELLGAVIREQRLHPSTLA